MVRKVPFKTFKQEKNGGGGESFPYLVLGGCMAVYGAPRIVLSPTHSFLGPALRKLLQGAV